MLYLTGNNGPTTPEQLSYLRRITVAAWMASQADWIEREYRPITAGAQAAKQRVGDLAEDHIGCVIAAGDRIPANRAYG